MDKNYFIKNRVNNQYKNSLDKMLHRAFSKFESKIINEKNLQILDDEFKLVVKEYQDHKGKAAIPKYTRWDTLSYMGDYILIEVSESLQYSLMLIRGEVK